MSKYTVTEYCTSNSHGYPEVVMEQPRSLLRWLLRLPNKRQKHVKINGVWIHVTTHKHADADTLAVIGDYLKRQEKKEGRKKEIEEHFWSRVFEIIQEKDDDRAAIERKERLMKSKERLMKAEFVRVED